MTELSLENVDLIIEVLNALADYYRYTSGDMPIFDWCLDENPEDCDEIVQPHTLEYFLFRLGDMAYGYIPALIDRTAKMIPASGKCLPSEIVSIIDMAKSDREMTIEVLSDMADFLYDFQVIGNHHAVIECRFKYSDKLDAHYKVINSSICADQLIDCIHILSTKLQTLTTTLSPT